jgi:hypothetical protein
VVNPVRTRGPYPGTIVTDGDPISGISELGFGPGYQFADCSLNGGHAKFDGGSGGRD